MVRRDESWKEEQLQDEGKGRVMDIRVTRMIWKRWAGRRDGWKEGRTHGGKMGLIHT